MRTCKNCEVLGVPDSSNIYISCIECQEWKLLLKDELEGKKRYKPVYHKRYRE